ncbi:MAG: hypothetical protein IKI25_06965, partial [Bacteroidales bacterium]|nr:hypothetical protein [Bacteroidales bacterium]
FKEYSECNLRAVACDEYFRGNKYPQKEKMIIDFISEKQMTKVQAVEYAKEKLGYLPSKYANYDHRLPNQHRFLFGLVAEKVSNTLQQY